MEKTTIKDGLSLSFIENEDGSATIELDWNPETHPEHNIFEEMGQEQIIAAILKRCDELIEKNDPDYVPETPELE